MMPNTLKIIKFCLEMFLVLSGLASGLQNVSLASVRCLYECWKYTAQCATERLHVSLEEKHEERVKTGRTVETFIHLLAHLCSHVHDPAWLWQSCSGSTSTCHVELSDLRSGDKMQTRRSQPERVCVCVSV